MASSVARSRPSLTLGTVMRSGLASTTLKARLAVRGSVAQRLERTTHNREVDGSNPSGAIAVPQRAPSLLVFVPSSDAPRPKGSRLCRSAADCAFGVLDQDPSRLVGGE